MSIVQGERKWTRTDVVELVKGGARVAITYRVADTWRVGKFHERTFEGPTKVDRYTGELDFMHPHGWRMLVSYRDLVSLVVL
ncbi:hypothetical protein [Nonomuraea roseola]|uniref:Uncharacterized protein n=1 Tax=Nonomuraea roseola TaxID=46179 RepID=A0ABV5Q0N0_9ACTN